MRLVVVGIQTNGGAKMLKGFPVSAQREHCLPDLGVCTRVVRVFPHNALLVGNGIDRQLLEMVRRQRCPVLGVARQDLKRQLRHLVGGLRTVTNPPGGLVRIMQVSGGVIVGEAHHHLRALGKEHRLRVTVIPLPVEVPLFDEQQPALASVRQNGIALHFLCEIVGMRTDPQDLHIHGQQVGVLNRVVPGSGRNIDTPLREAQKERRMGGRLLGEVEADRRLDLLKSAAGVQMDLKHQVRVLLQRPRKTLALGLRSFAWFPSKHLTGGHRGSLR